MQSPDELRSRFHYLRGQIQSLQKLYYHYSMQIQRYNRKKDYSKIHSLNSQKNGFNETIDKHKEESIAIILDLCRRTDFEKVDLHGLYLEEAEEVVMMVLKEVREHIRRSMNVKNSSGHKGKWLEIVTGKGLHSKKGAVLQPKIKDYLLNQGYKIKPENGRILVHVK